MKVLIINIDKNIFEPGSASLKRLRLYAGFCEKMKVTVLTLQKFPPIKEDNLEVFATGSGFRLKYFFDVWAITKRIFKKEKMDLVMTQDPFETGLLGWLIKRKYKLPWQCQIHGDIFSPYFFRESFINKLRVLLAKFLLPKADGIRVVSERIKKSLSPLSLKAKISVLPIFVDVEKFKTATPKMDLKIKYPQFDFVTLVASRLSREKNIDLAIDSLAGVIKKYPKTGLVIVGDGKEKNRLRKLVNNYNLQKNVIFESWSSDLASYYKTADIFLLTSNYEGWGMTVVEAAACACPIVMTDVGCAGEFIKDRENGLVVGINNRQALILAIEQLIQNENLGKHLSEEAQKAVLSMPNEEQYLKSYRESFTCLI